MNPREYREHLYKNRYHPPRPEEGFVDNRDSWVMVYASLLPFLIAEYFAERTWESTPAGLIFPTGFLLFWAFYYTYYKPGFLEDKLTTPKKFDLWGVPSVLLTVVILSVKVCVIELSNFVVRRWVSRMTRSRRPSQQQQARPKQEAQRPFSAPPPHGGAPKKPADPKLPELPSDVSSALGILGIPNCRDWQSIHSRYRVLAKQFHPDLNPDITVRGRRFMMYDVAYHKLSTVRGKYFK